jgi:hypothetical protein
MSNLNDQQPLLEQLVENGFVVFDQVLSQDMISRLRVATDCILDVYRPTGIRTGRSGVTLSAMNRFRISCF